MVSSVGLLLLLTFALFLCDVPQLHVQARFVSRPRREIAATSVTADSVFSSASWIWASASNGVASTSPGNVAFVTTLSTPSGKTAASAVVYMTAVDSFTLWVNGQPIGASGTGQDDWKSAQMLRAALNTSTNVFSVLVRNSANPSQPSPGLLAAIQVTYSDSTNSTFLSNSSWFASTNIPTTFPTSTDSSFTPAAVAASYGSGSWGQDVSLPSTDPNPLNFSGSNWIWSTATADTDAPVGTVGFRKTFSTPAGKSAQSAVILLTADDFFSLYLNGVFIGSPPDDPNATLSSALWEYAQQFTITLTSSVNVFTVIATNVGAGGAADPAGLIAAIKINYTDGSSDIIRTDSSWVFADFVSLSSFLATSDASLSPSITQGGFGIAPWGQLVGISDALNANSVPTAPFNATTSTPASTPSSTPNSESSHHSVPIAAIVGPVVGVLAVAAVVVFFLIWRRRRQNSSRAMLDEPKPLTTIVPFSDSPPNAEFSSTVPSTLPTTNASVAGSSSGAPSMQRPLPTTPPSKIDPITVMRMNGMQPDGSEVEHDVPPPRYTYSLPTSSLGVSGEPRY